MSLWILDLVKDRFLWCSFQRSYIYIYYCLHQFKLWQFFLNNILQHWTTNYRIIIENSLHVKLKASQRRVCLCACARRWWALSVWTSCDRSVKKKKYKTNIDFLFQRGVSKAAITAPISRCTWVNSCVWLMVNNCEIRLQHKARRWRNAAQVRGQLEASSHILSDWHSAPWSDLQHKKHGCISFYCHLFFIHCSGCETRLNRKAAAAQLVAEQQGAKRAALKSYPLILQEN